MTIPSNIASEIIFSELTIKNKKWIFFSVYRPTNELNLSTYDNVVVVDDFKNDIKEVTNQSLENLNTLCETLAYQIRSRVTLVTLKLANHPDLILTNKTCSFQFN